MINWETVKTESITNINDIVDSAGEALLEGLSDTKAAVVNLQDQCQVSLDNYRLACNNLTEDEDSAGIVLLEGLTDTKKAGVDLKTQCQFSLDNYKSACSKLSEEEDSSLISKANTYLET